MIHIEESCGELCLRLVGNDAVCSSRPCSSCEEQSAYWVAGVQATYVKKFSAMLLKWFLFWKIWFQFTSCYTIS